MGVEVLSQQMAWMLATRLEDVDRRQAFRAYGVDSFIAVELRSWLGKNSVAHTPVLKIVSGKMFASIAAGGQDA